MNKLLEKHSLPELILETESLDRPSMTTKQLTMFLKKSTPPPKKAQRTLQMTSTKFLMIG